MRLKVKVILLAVIPLAVSLLLIVLAVIHQERTLAQRERALVEAEYMNARRAELRHYVDLAVSTVAPLYNSSREPALTRAEALRLLATLDYGSDGYFFVYDMAGVALMHSRQPELVGRNLWELRDPAGHATIQRLSAAARAGTGYVEYLWHQPSSGKLAPKLGYVVELPRWNVFLGTGLYLDDVRGTIEQLDQQVSHNISTTLLWIAGIATLGFAAISACGIWLNVSEHRLADHKLRLMARQVVRSQEIEREHLARDLHDGSSQTLVAAKLLVESAVDTLRRDASRALPQLTLALSRITDSLNEMRRISHRLRPALLDRLGLPAALQQLAHESSEATQMQVSVAVSGTAHALPDEVTTALFRVAQEALTNIAKHAHAARVVITLEFEGSEGVRLDVSDDGCGFDPVELDRDPRRGIGLRNIRERLAALGGTVVMDSSVGHGARISAHLGAGSMAAIRQATADAA